MHVIKKYFSICLIYYRSSISRDLAFRTNFILGVVGAFCFVLLNYFIVIFLFDKIAIGPWSKEEMLVFLGNFYILWYAIFFLFFRGFIYLTRYIRSGLFDYYLIRPADTQFLVSIIGGGIYNLLAVFFGIGLVVYGLVMLNVSPSLLSVVLWLVAIIVAIIDCYSLILLLVTLNFRYGYMEEIVHLAFRVQEFSRYPLDAFYKMPVFVVVFAVPFSALSTIPTMVLIHKELPLSELTLFFSLSGVFIFIVRQIWTYSLRHYTSFA